MKRPLHKLILASLLVTALAGCGGRSSSSTTTTPPAGARQEDQLGTGFGIAFRQDANAVPVDPKDTDLNPVNMTADPVALK